MLRTYDRSYISKARVIPKRSQAIRLIVDMRYANMYTEQRTFK